MSEQKEFIKRMEIAVAKAYKSISVLKDENKKLLEENNLLKQQLQQFYNKELIKESKSSVFVEEENKTKSREVDKTKPEEGDKANSEVRMQVVSETSHVNHAFDVVSSSVHMTSKPTTSHITRVNFHARHVDVKTSSTPEMCPPLIGCESGWEDSSWYSVTEVGKGFPDVKAMSSWLESGARNVNVHALAQFLLRDSPKFNPADMGKALFVDITRCVDQSDETEGCWLNPAQLTGVSLIPMSISGHVNQLVSLIVSLATLTNNGLVNATRLLSIMKNIYMALVRSALPSPLHAILMPEKIASVGEQSESDLVADSEELMGGDNLEEDVEKEEEEEEGVKKEEIEFADEKGGSLDVDFQISSEAAAVARKSELSALFGFAADDDSDDSSSDSDDVVPHDRDGAQSGESTSQAKIFSANSVVQAELPSAVVNASTTVRPIKPFQRHLLLDSGKFYLLLRAALRLGLTSLVGDILSELLLSTAREVPLGIAVAILDAFRGEEIFLSPTFGTIGNVLSVVCESWVTLIEAKLNRVVCPGDNAVNILRNEILIRLRALSISLRGDSLTSTSESSQEVFVGLTKTLISLKGETPREAKVGLKQRLTVAARRLGFWQSVLSVSEIGLQTDPRPANSALTAVGMGCLVGDARRVIALLKRSDLFATYRRTNGMHLLESSDVSISPDTGFADLLETSCQLGLDEHLSDDDEEVRAINHFRDHWKRTLSDSNNSLGGYIAILSCLLESLFRSEVASGGWRTGHSGDGVNVETRLRNRMSVGSDLMRKMPQLGWHSRSVGPSSRTNRLMNQSSTLSSAGRWYRYSSVDCEELGHAASFVDHCTKQTALVMNNDDDKTLSYEEKMSRQQAWSGISAVVKDIASLIATALLERYLFLIVCSLRALLLEVNKAVDSNTCKQPVVVAVAEAISCLLVIPAPWGAACGARGDIAHDVINALHNLRRLPSIIDSSLSKELVLIASDWTARMVRRIPVFVINLDRRRDRWRKFVLANERMGVNAIRVCAVDGASYVSVDSDEGMSRSLNNLVPETDVLSFWDSTLNNQFDSGCMVNTHTPLTPAERACATSHLKVWRAIAGIRARLGLGAPQTRQDQAVDHVGCTSAGMKGMDLAHCVYAMYHRETTFRKKRSMVDLSSSEEQDYYLVFEDDAAVPLAKQAGFRKDVALLMRKLPIHVDILYLGGAVPKRANGFKCKFACDKLFNQVNYIWMLHAYIIRGRAVDILLSNLPIHSPVDNFLASLIYQNQLVAFVVTNELVGQSQGSLKDRRNQSDIRHSGRVTQQHEFTSRSAAVALSDKAHFSKTKVKTPSTLESDATNIAKRQKV